MIPSDSVKPAASATAKDPVAEFSNDIIDIKESKKQDSVPSKSLKKDAETP